MYVVEHWLLGKHCEETCMRKFVGYLISCRVTMDSAEPIVQGMTMDIVMYGT